jgi:hypothetical protein
VLSIVVAAANHRSTGRDVQNGGESGADVGGVTLTGGRVVVQKGGGSLLGGGGGGEGSSNVQKVVA